MGRRFARFFHPANRGIRMSIFKSIGAMAGAVASNPLTKMLAAQFLPGALPMVNLVADAVSGISARMSGDRAGAMAALQRIREGEALDAFPEDVRKGLLIGAQSLGALEEQGLAAEQVNDIIDKADAEGRPVVIADLQEYVQTTQVALDAMADSWGAYQKAYNARHGITE